jgi:acetate kinase
MASTYLIINIGSSSKKYALYVSEGDSINELYHAHFERDGDRYFLAESNEQSTEIPQSVFESAYEHVLMMCEKYQADTALSAVALRVVAPGSFFQKHSLIDNDYLSELSRAERFAPLHIKPLRAEIKNIQNENINAPLYALSDSAFHHTMPSHARQYGLPRSYATEKDMYRFGYHGLSVEYAITTLKQKLSPAPSRVIVCHLGSGVSITAVKNGASIDTSMGYSPLEGLIMSTRSGDVDPSVVLRMARERGIESTERILYHESGLLGLSNKSDDMKTLVDAESSDEHVKDTIASFVYRVQKYIGAYHAALGGRDTLVFTGTMGERSDPIRLKICKGLSHLGVTLDEEKNKKPLTDLWAQINKEHHVPICVIHADEATHMAHILNSLVSK